MTAAQDALPRTRLAVAMNARGWSQADVIRRLRHAAELRGRRLPSDGTMTSQLSRWARGVHRPDAFHRSLFREVTKTFSATATTGCLRRTSQIRSFWTTAS